MYALLQELSDKLVIRQIKTTLLIFWMIYCDPNNQSFIVIS